MWAKRVTPMVEICTKRSAPAPVAASSTRWVPTTLTSHARSVAMLLDTIAAVWITTAPGAMASAQPDGSRTSPAMTPRSGSAVTSTPATSTPALR